MTDLMTHLSDSLSNDRVTPGDSLGYSLGVSCTRTVSYVVHITRPLLRCTHELLPPPFSLC